MTDDPLAGVYASIDALLDYAVRRLELNPLDVDWKRNQVLELLGLGTYHATGETCGEPLLPDAMLERFRTAIVDAGLCDADESQHMADGAMGLLSARPSGVAARFAQEERIGGGMDAMRWLYDYCVANNYVKKGALDHNPRFDSHGLTVTINLAKPEFKDMRRAAAGNAVAGGYPACTICHTNEGYAPRGRRTLRTIPVTLGGEPWFWQFSPYGYFNQHGICVNMEHTPMHVDRDTFSDLIDFVERFPGYFLGCNAALPRIGGSVLAHDHYQGGGELMPMHKAAAWRTFTVPGRDDVEVEILDWPGTAVRVVSPSRKAIVATSDLIRRAWIDHDDPEHGIASHDADGNRQSALSPSVIRTDRGWEMHLIFRNNAVSERYPQGVFHAHPEHWAIKQEPIGLIEAQGLFILPGRLVGQLAAIEDALVHGKGLPDGMDEFGLVWDELTAALDGGRDRETVRAAIRDELGSVCERILANTAVFKDRTFTAAFLADLGLRDAHLE
ncbi:galactose-1-phosphate uridylyltransferase [Bifidobacterium stellenboschense]|uniref:Galactose-1-phosphate uridylyltransferase n=1 Tax=Bifidobacterium stellenboschense TaxID=762211 RepID=A0A087E099_9BIFI|nr:galactose-1-phosphate uridylyltransferase [Bifidobacterium stellenboschense]KFJ01200.1 putative UTP--hexose-1-phosphate uridylyltransferase [Bifidobacterium stellenboschense]